ncbi:hypothetical protein EVAR_76038_1 [Eumeta japonica]|uniref:Uncharacterized protein n=1 Tax=Eumeta variegata TaxID=151549 RepID=A0A4C1UA58_EUMVA|nr:hypothetical protein EVAR_76038_1 [Eumeta japonica]
MEQKSTSAASRQVPFQRNSSVFKVGRRRAGLDDRAITGPDNSSYCCFQLAQNNFKIVSFLDSSEIDKLIVHRRYRKTRISIPAAGRGAGFDGRAISGPDGAHPGDRGAGYVFVLFVICFGYYDRGVNFDLIRVATLQNT